MFIVRKGESSTKFEADFPGISILLVSLHLNLFGRVLHLFCLIELNTICWLRFMKGNRRDINLARSIKNQPLM